MQRGADRGNPIIVFYVVDRGRNTKYLSVFSRTFIYFRVISACTFPRATQSGVPFTLYFPVCFPLPPNFTLKFFRGFDKSSFEVAPFFLRGGERNHPIDDLHTYLGVVAHDLCPRSFAWMLLHLEVLRGGGKHALLVCRAVLPVIRSYHVSCCIPFFRLPNSAGAWE